MMIRKKKLLAFLLVLSIFLGIVVQGGQVAFAANEVTSGIAITNFKLTHKDGTIGDFIEYDNVRLNLNWDASSHGSSLKSGDFFYVTLPDKLKFPSDSAATNFNITDPDDSNVIVATGVVTPGAEGGGTVKITFTDFVENKNNIKGNMYLDATFYKEKITMGQSNEFKVEINGIVQSTEAVVNVDPGPVGEVVGKWGQKTSNPEEVHWVLRINHTKQNYTNVIITDKLSAEGGDLKGMRFIADSFILKKVKLNEMGNVIELISETNITVNLSDDGTEFTYELGDITENDQYRLEYKSTYVPGMTVKNNVTFIADGIEKHASGTYQSASSGGSGDGDLLSKIKLIKVDAEDKEIKLSGAVFKLTRLSDNAVFTLTTDENGEVISEKLTPGKYKIEEITPPVGYVKIEEDCTITIEADKPIIHTVENNRIKTEIEVEKKWSGKQEESATIELFADGKKVNEIILNSENNWKHTFTELDKFKDGKEIVYTVKEVKIENYETVVTGDAENGFIITNTHKPPVEPEKIDIPVKKVWETKKGTSVTVNLFADGEKVDSIVLNDENEWKHTFTGLDKFKDGKEIVYTVKEVRINSYETVITGNVEKGFVITNKYNPPVEPEKIEIPVKKIWEIRKGTSATVNLFADGEKIDSIVLNDGNDWKHTFKNLDKFKNGKEIIYTISEVKIDRYDTKIIGNPEDGFTVVNIYNPPYTPEKPGEKTSVTGRKVWVGGPDVKPTIELQLYRNGISYGSAVTLEDGKLTYTWYNLDARDSSGRLYVYTVEETRVPNGYTSKRMDNGTTIVNIWDEPEVPPKTPPTDTPPSETPPSETPPVEPKPVEPKPSEPVPAEPEPKPDSPRPAQPKPSKPTIVPKTGDDGLIFIYGGILLLAVVALGRTVLKRSKGR